MKLWELLDRPEEGPIPNDQFRAILAKAASEFGAQPKKSRRRDRGRSVAQVEPAPTFDIVEELH